MCAREFALQGQQFGTSVCQTYSRTVFCKTPHVFTDINEFPVMAVLQKTRLCMHHTPTGEDCDHSHMDEVSRSSIDTFMARICIVHELNICTL